MSADSGVYVRDYYRVPAHKGGRVVVDNQRGTITGFRSQYLLVRFDGVSDPKPCHPTWRVIYLERAVTQ